jgi:hypothetical protein
MYIPQASRRGNLLAVVIWEQFGTNTSGWVGPRLWASTPPPRQKHTWSRFNRRCSDWPNTHSRYSPWPSSDHRCDSHYFRIDFIPRNIITAEVIAAQICWDEMRTNSCRNNCRGSGNGRTKQYSTWMTYCLACIRRPERERPFIDYAFSLAQKMKIIIQARSLILAGHALLSWYWFIHNHPESFSELVTLKSKLRPTHM